MPNVPLTRARFIADDHVQIAISNLKTIWWKDEGEPLKQISMPQSIKDSEVLPDGYCVDFAHDPITMVHALAKINIRYESQLEESVLSEMKAIVNAPDNLAIVPIHVRDSKLQETIQTLGPLEASTADKENSSPDNK